MRTVARSKVVAVFVVPTAFFWFVVSAGIITMRPSVMGLDKEDAPQVAAGPIPRRRRLPKR